MKKILITGSNGLLGQKLVYKLIQHHNVTVIATSKGDNRLVNKSGYIFESLDITSKENVTSILTKFKPDVIINTAAMTNVDVCEIKQSECWKINVDSVKNIVDTIQEAGAVLANTHLIHLSTDFIFDGEKGSAYVEGDKPNPLSYYALSKHEAEKVIQQSTIKWAIARTIIVYGIVDNMSRSNIVLWAKSALEKGEKINVVDDQFRSPTLAEDLADGCILIEEKAATGIYHLSGKDIMSVLELVYAVADYWKLDKSLITPVKSNTLNQAAKRPPRTGFDISKAVRDLNYAPHTFAEGLAFLDRQLKATSNAL